MTTATYQCEDCLAIIHPPHEAPHFVFYLNTSKKYTWADDPIQEIKAGFCYGVYPPLLLCEMCSKKSGANSKKMRNF